MPPKLALLCSIVFVVWLIVIDRKRHGRLSGALWLPVIWLFIAGTKSPDAWLGIILGHGGDTQDGNLSTIVFIGLLTAGLGVLSRRAIDWPAVVSFNKWLVLYFLYLGISIAWSDQPFASLKLWIKDSVNVVMVLIILTEPNAAEAVKTSLVRAACILVTLSVLLVKYFPDLGRTYDKWTHRPIMIGAGTDKNSLGATLLVCALGLFWSFLGMLEQRRERRWNLIAMAGMIAMTLWLLVKSQCATALVCTIAGASLMTALRVAKFRDTVRRLGLAVFIVTPLLLISLQLVFNLAETLLKLLGRDLTLTARTDIWKLCLETDINSLVGAGYCGFWYGTRARSISEDLGFYYDLKEAHNGYLEVYLNGGWIGLLLLAGVLISGAARILKNLDANNSWTALRLALLSVGMVYNITESVFSGLNPIWFVLLLALLEYPRFRPTKNRQRDSETSGSDSSRPQQRGTVVSA